MNENSFMEAEFSRLKSLENTTISLLSLFFAGWKEITNDEICFARTALAFTLGRICYEAGIDENDHNYREEENKKINSTIYFLHSYFLVDRMLKPNFSISQMPINILKTAQTKKKSEEHNDPYLDGSFLIEKEYSKFEDANRITTGASYLFFNGWKEKQAEEITFAETALAFTVGKYYHDYEEIFRQLNLTMRCLHSYFYRKRMNLPDFKISEMPVNLFKTPPRPSDEKISEDWNLKNILIAISIIAVIFLLFCWLEHSPEAVFGK